MDQELLKDVGLHGLISLVISVVVTYGVHMVLPSTDIQWALIAVALAGFFSSASSAYVKNQE